MRVSGFFATLLLLFVCNEARKFDVPKLNSYSVDKNRISVSGLSSGGFFAVQFHVAFSKTLMGVGVIAGGPYWCAQENLDIALSACTTEPDLISVQELVAVTFSTALTDTIDSTKHMASDKVYLFSGVQDSVVVPGVMKKLAQYYSSFITTGGMVSEFSIPAEHAIVTDDYGNKCDYFGSPFINNCNYSTAYNILQQIYGNITYASNSAMNPANLLEFDQSEFFSHLPSLVDMDTTGYVYVPSNCQRDNAVACSLHVAFHGCLQGRIFLSDVYARHAGYNGVAEANNIIVLYPQAVNSTLNPKGCWDWWGYTSPAYASKLGPQMAGVKLMVDRLARI